MRYLKVFILVISTSLFGAQDYSILKHQASHVASLERVVTSHSKTIHALEDTIRKLAKQVSILNAKLDREDSRRAAKQEARNQSNTKKASDSHFKSPNEGVVTTLEDRSIYYQAGNMPEEKNDRD